MFRHIFTYRFKCIIRDKQAMFWMLLFPLLLATLFHMAFANLMKGEAFETINIAIVDNSEYQKEANFKSMMDNVSKSNDLFNVKYSSKDEADDLLKYDKISGYVFFENGLKLVVKGSGIGQTILKSFLDDYLQTTSSVLQIINANPDAMNNGLLTELSNREAYVKAVSPSKAAPNTTVIYFYTLIAMTCFYACFMGMTEITGIQANLSSQAARSSVAPIHKLKLFLYSLCAATAIELLAIFIVLAYLALVLKVDFGNNFGLISLTCVAGCFVGISFGAMISALLKCGEGIKSGIMIAVAMSLSFLSGMMMVEMKYIIANAAPIMAYINPVNLITDAFYSLYYYDTYTRFYMNIGLLFGFTTIFCLVTYFILRRQRYASI